VSYNYTQWVADLANILVIPPADPNFQIVLPNIIDDSEQRIYRELDLLATIVRDQSGSLTANSRNFTFPQHMIVCESLNVFTPSGTTTNRNAMVPVTREFLDYVWGNEAATGSPSVPQYYAMITDQTIIVGPPPDAGYTMEVVGTIRPTPLSAANPTTYLTLYLPDLFMAESAIFGYLYMKDAGSATDDPQSSASWVAHYKDLWQSANTEETRKKYASQAWTPKNPSDLSTPPRA
jgi:hypothetical protein